MKSEAQQVYDTKVDLFNNRITQKLKYPNEKGYRVLVINNPLLYYFWKLAEYLANKVNVYQLCKQLTNFVAKAKLFTREQRLQYGKVEYGVLDE